MEWYEKIHWTEIAIKSISFCSIFFCIWLVNYALSWKKRYFVKCLQNFKAYDFKKALFYVNKLLISNQNQPKLLLLKGICYYGLNGIGNSLNDFAGYFKYADLVTADACSFIGLVLFRGNEFSSSVSYTDKSIELEPNNKIYRKIRALIFIYNNKFDEALKDINFILHNTKDVTTENLYLYCMKILYNETKSVVELDDLVVSVLEESFVYHCRALLLKEFGNDEEALQKFKKLFEIV